MNEVTIQLIPAPGVSPEFLATLTPLGEDAAEELPFEITLGKYSREKWATQDLLSHEQQQQKTPWKSMWFRSIDGRKKLPGFLKYLRERKKAAFGTFEPAVSVGEDDENAVATRAIFVVPPDQPTPPADNDDEPLVWGRYALNERWVVPNKHHARAPSQQQPPVLPPPPKPIVTTKKTKSGAAGLLGNLLGQQRETDAFLAAVPKRSVVQKSTTNTADEIGNNDDDNKATTGAGVLNGFRRHLEQTLSDFKDAAAGSKKITINMNRLTKDLEDTDEKLKVSMDVLRFVFNELVEEIGEDKWLTAKEPSEFLDEETVISVYKEGHVPKEVMEEQMRGDMPSELVSAERAIKEASAKQGAMKQKKLDLARQQAAIRQGSQQEVQELNTNKRDRRTIAEIQNDAKKSRTE